MLQSLHLMGMNKEIQSQDVYNFTGNPSPNMVQGYINTLMDSNVKEALETLETDLKENGISMQTLVKELYSSILTMGMLPNEKI